METKVQHTHFDTVLVETPTGGVRRPSADLLAALERVRGFEALAHTVFGCPPAARTPVPDPSVSLAGRSIEEQIALVRGWGRRHTELLPELQASYAALRSLSSRWDSPLEPDELAAGYRTSGDFVAKMSALLAERRVGIEVWDAYRVALLSDAKCEDVYGITDRIDGLAREEAGLSRRYLGFGRYIFREALKECCVERSRLEDIRSALKHDPFPPDWQLPVSSPDALARYDADRMSLVLEVMLRELESERRMMSNRGRDREAEFSPPNLPRELLAELQKRSNERLVAQVLAKLEEGEDAGTFDFGGIRRDIEVVLERASLGANRDGNEPFPEAEAETDERSIEAILARLPQSVAAALNDEVSHRMSWRRTEWQNAFRWVTDHAEEALISEVESIQDRLLRFIAAQPACSTWERETIRSLIAMNAHTNASIQFVVNHDRATLADFEADSAVISHFGEPCLARARELLERQIIAEIGCSRGLAKEIRVELGFKALRCRSAAAVPIVLLNSYIEPGFSGERPFVGCPGSPHDIQTYVSGLDEATVTAVKALDIPGCSEALDILRARGSQVVGDFDSEVSSVLAPHLESLTAHLLRHGEQAQLPLVRRAIIGTSGDISLPMAEAIREVCARGSDVLLVQAVAERVNRCSGTEAARLLLDIAGSNSFGQGELNKAQALLIMHLTAHDALTPEQLQTLSDQIGDSVESIKVTRNFFLAVHPRDSKTSHYHSRPHDFAWMYPAYRDCATIPGVTAALQSLEEYGYTFYSEAQGAVPEIVKHASEIAARMEQLRRSSAFSSATYQPAEWRDPRTREQDWYADPFAVQLLGVSYPRLLAVLTENRDAAGRVDPLVTRCAYAAWRAADQHMTEVLGDAGEPPAWFQRELDRWMGGIEFRPVGAADAALRTETGRLLLSRGPEWSNLLRRVSEQARSLTGNDDVAAADLVFGTMELLQRLNVPDDAPPRWLTAVCGFFLDDLSTVDRVQGQRWYDENGTHTLQAATVTRAVETLAKLKDAIDTPETVTAFAAACRGPTVGFSAIASGVNAVVDLITTPKDLVRVVDTLSESAARIGDGAGESLGDALQKLNTLGWLKLDASFPRSVAQVEDIIRQGLAEPATWALLERYYGVSAHRGAGHEPTKVGDPVVELAIFGEFIKLYGSSPLTNLYPVYARCSRDEPLTEHDREVSGITQTGRAGLQYLRGQVQRLRGKLLGDDGIVGCDTPVEVDLVAALTRFHTSQWRRHGESLQYRMDAFNRAFAAGRVAPLSAGFVAAQGQSMRVHRLDRRAVGAFAFSEDARVKVAQFQSDITAVAGRSLAEVATTARADLRRGVAARIAELERPLTEAEASRDAAGRRARGRLEECARWREFATRVAETADIVELVKAIGSFEKKDDPITTPISRRCLARLGLEQLGADAPVIELSKRPIDREVVLGFAEFFGGVINSDVIRHLDLSDREAMRLSSAISTKALTAELGRLNSIATAGTDVIGFKPTRGLLGELSGYVCDACWTAEDNIMERYPQVTAVVFVRGQGTPNERLCGATLVMKVRTLAGTGGPPEDVFMIRGFNPLENTVAHLNAGEFFEGFVDWLKGVARTEGVTKIVVPGGAVGGSQTNRPSIHTFVQTTYGRRPIVPLDSRSTTTFNGYVVDQSCRLVWSANEADLGR